jgi:signal transduction histidine kinase
MTAPHPAEDPVREAQTTRLKKGLASLGPRLTARLPAWLQPDYEVAGLSLARRYLLVSLLVVVVGGALVAYALGMLIETSAINRTASVTALYAESFVAPQLQSLASDQRLTESEVDALQGLLSDSALSQRVVSFRIWSLDGEVLYSPQAELIGRTFEMSDHRREATTGALIGEISELGDPENAYERERWDRLIEIYVPVRSTGSSEIIAVAEFYQLPDELEAEVFRDRLIAWALVAGATALAYLALVRVVQHGSETIVRQQGELRQRVDDLSTLLEQNARLSDRLRHAAERTTAITEMERRRIGSDLHDGPSQALAFAMLRLDTVEARLDRSGQAGDADLAAVRDAVQDALGDMRTIAAGLRTPELELAPLPDLVRNAVADHERRSGTSVALDIDALPDEAPLATKIALYRVLAEALSNATRHGDGLDVRVTAAKTDDGLLALDVTDAGPGFEAAAEADPTRLGLAGMRERVELLGGRMEVTSTPGSGTRVHVLLPLAGPKAEAS